MSFGVRVLPRAQRDIEQIDDYLHARSPGGARRWREALKRAIQTVSQNPGLGSSAPENQFTHIELRQIFFRTPRGLKYRAVYTVVSDELFVLRVRGPGQPPLEADEIPLN